MPHSIRKSPAARKPDVRPVVPPAETFRRSRRDRASETAQDYVEAIADLTASVGEARVVDLARRLGVTHVTVNRTLARLKKSGLREHQALPRDFSDRRRTQTGRGKQAAA